ERIVFSMCLASFRAGVIRRHFGRDFVDIGFPFKGFQAKNVKEPDTWATALRLPFLVRRGEKSLKFGTFIFYTVVILSSNFQTRSALGIVRFLPVSAVYDRSYFVDLTEDLRGHDRAFRAAP